MLEDVKSLVAKLHIKMCKQILQMYKRADNYAVRLSLEEYLWWSILSVGRSGTLLIYVKETSAP